MFIVHAKLLQRSKKTQVFPRSKISDSYNCHSDTGTSKTNYLHLLLVNSSSENFQNADRTTWKLTVHVLGRRSFIDPICCNSCMVLSMFLRLVLANSLFSLPNINLTLGLLPPRRQVVWRDSVGVESSGSGLKIRVRGYFSSELSLVVAPYLRAPKRAKQLSMVTIPLCFEFFRCLVDVLKS